MRAPDMNPNFPRRWIEWHPPARLTPDSEAARMDRQADVLLHLGRHQQAERLAHLAAALRQAVAKVSA